MLCKLVWEADVLGNKTSKDDTYSRLWLRWNSTDVIIEPELEIKINTQIAREVWHGSWKAVEIISVEWVVSHDVKDEHLGKLIGSCHVTDQATTLLWLHADDYDEH